MRCPECGVTLKDGDRRCDFCGTRVLPDEEPAAAPHATAAPGRLRAALDVLAAVGVGCLVAGAIYLLGTRGGDRTAEPDPAAGVADVRRLALQMCEEGIRREVRAPFRVIGFRSALAADAAAGGLDVSGTVELQSAVGEVQLRRYSCRLRPAGAGLVLESGRLH